MRARTLLALGDSGYNERELRELGYTTTGTLPIVLDENRYRAPVDAALAAEIDDGRPLLLFVGRFAPNKRQEDLLKLHYCLRRLSPRARLVLVGNTAFESYVAWQQQFVAELGLDGDAVRFAGHVSQREMITYFRRADVYVSMSEHEGFGKPLIESMYFGLPVIAYAATAVPDTLGDAGIMFYEKHYEALAELVHLVLTDEALRRRVIARQTQRVKAFLEPQVRRRWEGFLRQTGLMADGTGR
jgi:glycosyltransferase involved in cell wall biosynthesis